MRHAEGCTEFLTVIDLLLRFSLFSYVEVGGEGREIFKDPITDDGTKKSAKGLLHVGKNPKTGELELRDMVSKKTESEGELRVIFKNGKFYNRTTLTEVRNKISNLITNPQLVK